ncbi:hypothetical protein ANANG_G00220650 [Anguilla anguilla]|uniref:Interleukin-23 subunit p19 n=1 Tax=Anguilla anguilla TaxID=7936 RepID=A0A9D3M032_ANGAN|nr:hypothetical protein ANANG_G00220650 [Anguilla anguilla]
MQSLSLTVVVLALVLALTGVREANGAPIINWDRCTEISVRLNQLAKHLAKEVLDGSRGLIHDISEQVVLVEPSDMCDPAGLKIDSKPCLQKIITALGNYSRIFRKEELFLGSNREMAWKVSVTVSDFLGQLGAQEPEGLGSDIHAWMQDDLAQYSVERLLSFSILVARVFAAGNPAAHDDAPPTYCHQS